jgi:SPOC domain
LLEPDSQLSLEDLVRLSPEELNDGMAVEVEKAKVESLKRVFKKELQEESDDGAKIAKKKTEKKPKLEADLVYKPLDEEMLDSPESTHSLSSKMFPEEEEEVAAVQVPVPVKEEKKVFKRRKPVAVEPPPKPVMSSLDDLLAKMQPATVSQPLSATYSYPPQLSYNAYTEPQAEVPTEDATLSEPEPIQNEKEIIWQGKVVLPQVKSYHATAVQISEPMIEPHKFSLILPSTLFINGRIKPSAVHDYLKSRVKSSAQKPIVVISLSPISLYDHFVKTFNTRLKRTDLQSSRRTKRYGTFTSFQSQRAMGFPFSTSNPLTPTECLASLC